MTAHARPAIDRCPGLLRPHQAEDGLLVRVRIPGGQTDSGTLLALADGDGTLQLTSRGNIQLRGIAEHRLSGLRDRVIELGLLPSRSHELVRNIVASPLTGITPDRPDLRPLIRELDQAVCAKPELAALSGRFLFAIDDGRGDVWSLAFDIGYRAFDQEHGVIALGASSSPANSLSARLVDRSAAAAEMVQIAIDFLHARRSSAKSAWRVWEVGGLSPSMGGGKIAWPDNSDPAGVGPGVNSGAACVAVPLGFLTITQAAAVHSVANGGPVVITPWRGLIIPDAGSELHRLSAAGLITDPGSPWAMITACVGAPSCVKSLINTRQVAADLAGRQPAPSRPIHISGCERRCGSPAGDHEELVGHP